jgi:hypothetical protein
MDEKKETFSELSKALQSNVIAYDPVRLDYTVSESELNSIKDARKSDAKDIFILTLGICVPTIVNGILNLIKDNNGPNFPLEAFLNLLIGGIALCFSIFSLVMWQKSKIKSSQLFDNIKKKPKYVLPTVQREKIIVEDDDDPPTIDSLEGK